MGNSNRTNKLTHCVSLGSDPPLANNPGFFLFPQALKNFTSCSRQTKSHVFYSLLHMIASNLLSDPEFSLALSLTEHCSNIYQKCLKTGIAKA